MKYIVLSAGQEWNTYSWSGVTKDKNIRFVENLFSRIIKRIWRKTFFINKFFCLLIWFPFLKFKLKISVEETYIIIYDWHYLTKSPYLVELLKKQYKNVHLIYIFTNISKISGSTSYKIIDSLKKTYEKVFAFDRIDSERYEFEYSRLIYYPDGLVSTSDIEYDLIYVGQAKDRLDILHEIYDTATSQELRCKFYITGVPEEKKLKNTGIIYNNQISYKEVLELIAKSKGIVDAIQGESTGMTIKVCEAVIFNKKLISTNPHILKEPYFNKDNILLYDKDADIKKFMEVPMKDYSEEDKYNFSPYRLFHQINFDKL